MKGASDMSGDNNYIVTNIVDKYGEDDFSVWTVEIHEDDLKKALTDFVRTSGDPASVLNGLPDITDSAEYNVLHFYNAHSEQPNILSATVDDEFVGRYTDKGFSVRGSLQDILSELENIKGYTPNLAGYTAADKEKEQYALIEIFGRKALFTDDRIDRDSLPDGLFCYDIRHGDEGDACSLEATVYVNHYATVLCMTDFGLQTPYSYIPIDYDTEPNFLSEDATIDEYIADWVESNEPLPEVMFPPVQSLRESQETEYEQDDGLEP